MGPKRNVQKRKPPSNPSEIPGSSVKVAVSDDEFEQPSQKRRFTQKNKGHIKHAEVSSSSAPTEPSCSSQSVADHLIEKEIHKQGKRDLLEMLRCGQDGLQKLPVFDKVLEALQAYPSIFCLAANSSLQTIKSTVIRHVRELTVSKVLSPFDRRITALVWHPKRLNTLAVGSKGGDIILWNHNHPTPDVFIQGSGPGGSIQAMKFDIHNDSCLYTCSIEGTVCKRNFVTNQVNTFLDTGMNSIVNWYTSLDVSFTGGLIAAGDNKGYLNMLTKDGTLVWKAKMHRAKVHHIEFHINEPWVLVTSSLDNLVKIWDVRNIKDAKSCLVQLEHKRGVNTAHFSPCHGTRLLTTDQHSEMRIFSGPNWDLETSIPHPHRQFQHLTPIKADWHPLEDIVVIGRYPDPKFPGYQPTEPRSIDFFDASDGELLYQLESDGKNGIISLNRFDSIGEVLASAMGQHILLWRKKNPNAVESNFDEPAHNDAKTVRHPPTRRRRDDDGDLKKKTKSTKAVSKRKS